MTFKETLDLAAKNNIECGKLHTALEVNCFSPELKGEEYETLCWYLYDIWIDSNIDDLHAIIKAYFDLKEKGIETTEENIMDWACYN